MSHKSETESGEGIATYIVEAAVALIGIALGIIVIAGALDVGGAEWTVDGPGAGYFPFYMGVIILGACSWIFVRALMNKNKDVFVENEGLKRILAVLIPIIIYVAGVEFLGVYVAGTIYITLFMVILGKFSWIRSALTGVAVCAFFFAMFEIWFLVPLAKGRFEPLSFLGY